ncbi:MAG: hypothetical protein ACRDGA_04995 [Bacteroidota bacterium]
MNRYLLIAPHTIEDCSKVIKVIEAVSSVTRWDWGCKDGEHCGWVTVEADSREEALLTVPPIERHKARAVMLARFSAEDIKKMHE